MDGRETYGLTIQVYRTSWSGVPQDCTAGGVSATVERLTVVGTVEGVTAEGAAYVTPMPRDAQIFGPRDDAPAVALRRTNGGQGTVCLVPVEMSEDGRTYRTVDSWVMAGGNFGGTSDSRWCRLVEMMLGHRFYGAVAIHDRIEK